MGFFSNLKRYFSAKGAVEIHAKLRDSLQGVIHRYGQPISRSTGITVGVQRFDSVLEFQVGHARVSCYFINDELVRLVISAPPGLKLSPAAVEEFKNSYSEKWVDLSNQPSLPPEMIILASDNREFTIQIFKSTQIGLALARCFPVPAWLAAFDPPPPALRATAAQIGANLALAPPPPDSEDPRWMRPENHTTAEGQGWTSFVLRDLEDVDSLLATKNFRPLDEEIQIRNSIQPGEIKELWFHAVSPEPNLTYFVYVAVLFKNPSGQLHARGWFTSGKEESALGQKPQCIQFRDAAVRHYQEVLERFWGPAKERESVSTKKFSEAAPAETRKSENVPTYTWMVTENLVEVSADISVYHLIAQKDVEEFINDPNISRPSISTTRSSMGRREIKHILEEVSTNDGFGRPLLCIYTGVFWLTGAGRWEMRVCATFGNQRERQLELCEEFRRTWYKAFQDTQNYIRDFTKANLARNAENPRTTEGLPLAIAGTKEMTVEGMGYRFFGLTNTGEVNALLEELGHSARKIVQAREKIGQGEMGACSESGKFNGEFFIFSASFFRTRVGVLGSCGVYFQGPQSEISSMESSCLCIQREALEHFRELLSQEAQNN